MPPLRDRAPRSRALRASAATILPALLAAACDGTGQRAPEPTLEERLARERSAALYARDDREAAWTALQPLIEREDAAQRDLVHGACIQLMLGDLEKAGELLERARKLGEDDAALQYNLGRVAWLEADLGRAARHFRRAHELAPDDIPTTLRLADALEDTEPETSERLLRDVVELGVERAGSWYLPALYKLAMRRMRAGDEDAAAKMLEEHSALKQPPRSLPEPSALEADQGNLGRIPYPAPWGARPSGTGEMQGFEAAASVLPELAGARGLVASDLDNDGDLDLVGWGERGCVLGLQESGFAWRAQRVLEGSVLHAVVLDLDNTAEDQVMDLVLSVGSSLKLVHGRRAIGTGEISWTATDKALPALPGAPSDGVAVDFDHEGDLDLLFAGEFGAALLRNDGAIAPEGAFTDVTAEAGLPRGQAFRWCVTEDFDVDQDVDLWLVGAEGHFLASNLRGGKFEDATARLAEFQAGAAKPIAADLDGDARPDLWSSAGEGLLFLSQPSGGFRKAERALPELPPIAARGGGELFGVSAVHALDLDLDGALDVAWSRGGRLRGALSPGQSPVPLDLDLGLASDAACIADLDGDLDWDLVAVTDAGLAIRRGAEPRNHSVRLGFRGHKDNRRAVGAVVELRARGVYRRLYWRGEATLAGVGDERELDVLRITWPNGVVQYETRRDIGDRAATANLLEQASGLVGSCPFLYAWNGREHEFVTDVLGITPLGLPMAPGMLVPPDHDEHVLVRGEQLAPKDGFLELQFTEELREVTYLDRARLDVVDHPEDSEVFPNELFCFPPFPQAHTHTVRGALAPAKAIGSDGKDWTAALARIDGDHAAPFTPAEPQFLGLASPHFLELEFDPAAVRSAPKLRLVATGWFYWTDASVNVASARDPRHEFVPPILQVPDGRGGWRDAGPPLGFPAGKTKTMVIDVGSLLVRDDPRIRLFSTLRLYWDSLRLAVDADDAPLEVVSLEPASSVLWQRGFSDPEPSDRPHQPERFDWERLAWFPRWDQHPGMYTRLGETLPLVTEIDDRFVILGAGDALTLRFDARTLPPPKPGFRRDYLLFLDGWAKDRDPNTLEALEVEPLPFHGMSGYPYGPAERFPDDEAHRAWRREWNTRPARRWIEPLHERLPPQVVGRR